MKINPYRLWPVNHGARLLRAIRARLVDDWRQAWRWWSVRFGIGGAGLLALADGLREAWAYVPPDLRGALPYAQYVAYALLVAGFAARFVKQGGARDGGR